MKANPSRPRWQALAQALLPELHERFGAEETWKGGGAMPFFFELLAATRQAHLAGDEAFLLRAYAFAHWCMAAMRCQCALRLVHTRPTPDSSNRPSTTSVKLRSLSA